MLLGLLVVAAVLWYWLRRLTRAVVALMAIIEASVNRVAQKNGESPIINDIHESVFR